MILEWEIPLYQAAERLIVGLGELNPNEIGDEHDFIHDLILLLGGRAEMGFFDVLMSAGRIEQLLWKHYPDELQLLRTHLNARIQCPVVLEAITERGRPLSSQSSAIRDRSRSPLRSGQQNPLSSLSAQAAAGDVQAADASKELVNSKDGVACLFCPVVLLNQENYEEHLRVSKLCGAYSKNQCTYCGKCYTQKGTLTQHVQEAHEQIGLHTCATCGYRNASRSNMNKHEKRCQGGSLVTCTICHRGFATERGLMQHRQKIHKKY